MSCTVNARFLGLFSASLWTDRLKDCAGLHQIFNVLSQNRILRSQFQIFFLNSINPTRQIVQSVLKLQNLEKLLLLFIYSQLSRCNTARGSISRLSLKGPTMIKACKYFLFTEGSLKTENKEQLVDFVITLYL